ncbi:serine hydrolase [Streptomyces sp. B1866]|uniref:serine hydrolase n=1 Tax=Streptomyces sp. B1866 TaxID=3075431 RepID=UPI0028913B17|nr:serine hydrolase [Streptomyces sp. B1866]MDT3400742.1 serine hydrolase [Streptomyces sp. B1866]MDT3400743.1 serine hydrolase [Streptomyces sp. B1866]
MPPARAAASPRPARLSAEALADALRPVADGTGAAVSVAVLDTGTGASARYGHGAYDTASVVKVGILAALLLRAQDAGRTLTAWERRQAGVMIERSDNRAADALWRAIGGADGFDAAGARLGLTGTRGGRGGSWGLTRTTAADQLTLLRRIFPGGDEPSVLGARSRAYVSRLMGGVVPGQDWGVSAAAGDGAEAAATRLKNGWLPRSATGLWDVNSIGRVTADGRTYLLAVLSRGHTGYARGVAVVEAAARAAVRAAARTAARAAASTTATPRA